MGLFKRVGDVLAANLNELVDKCENPERMLKQAVREMEAALGRAMDGAARAIAHERLLARQLADQRREVERFQQAAENAVRRNDDAAARQALRAKGEHERMAQVLSDQATSSSEVSLRLRNQVAAMHVKLAEARRKLVEITARNHVVEARRHFAGHLQSSHGDGDIVSKFDRIYARVGQAEAETDALLELIGDNLELETFELDIENELQALKEKTNHGTP